MTIPREASTSKSILLGAKCLRSKKFWDSIVFFFLKSKSTWIRGVALSAQLVFCFHVNLVIVKHWPTLSNLVETVYHKLCQWWIYYLFRCKSNIWSLLTLQYFSNKNRLLTYFMQRYLWNFNKYGNWDNSNYNLTEHQLQLNWSLVYKTNFFSETDQFIFVLSHSGLKTAKFAPSSKNWPKAGPDSSQVAPSGPSNPIWLNRCYNCFYLDHFQNIWDL